MAGRKILIAVDLQKDFIDGSLALPGAAAVIPEIKKIMPGFEFVYFTLDWHPLNHCSFREQGGPWPPHCVHHTAGASLPDSVLDGLDESKLRFVLKGFRPEKEEYGAFSGVDAESQDLFLPGDEVTVCGIAAEYCVRETLINVAALAVKVGFKLSVYLPGTARFGSYDTLLETMKENGVTEYH